MKNILILGLATLSVAANANMLTNGDFATDTYPVGGYLSTNSVTGWNVFGHEVAGIGAGYLGAATQEIDLSGASDGTGSGILQSVASTDSTPYQVSFDVYTGGGTGNSGGVDFYVNGALLGSDLQGASTSTMDRQTYNYTFSGVGAATELKFVDNNGNVSHVANVSMEAVPEPASLFALGLPLVGLLKKRRA